MVKSQLLLTEQYGPYRPEHKNESDAPCDIGGLLIESLGQVGDGQRDGEKVECILFMIKLFGPPLP